MAFLLFTFANNIVLYLRITAPDGAFDGTLKRVTTVNEAALQGTSLYVVTKKDQAVTARSNKITFDGAGHATTSPLTAADIQTQE